VVTKVYDGENGKTPVKGIDYFDGEPGTNGLSAYLHIRYSQNSNGNPMTDDPTGAKYVGMQVSQNPNPSTVPADYDWTLVKGADGIPGETGADGQTSYLHIKYSNDGGQTFTGNGGEDVGTWMGQYVDFTQADSTDVKKYAWSKIKGEDGQDGVAGKDGVGLKSTAITYAQSASGTVAPSSGWTVQVPTLVKGQYLWTKTVWTYTDNTNETGYTVSYNAKDGNNGQDGIAGKDGVGIKSTKIEYASSTSGTTKPGVGWSLTIPTVPNGQFLWTRTTWTYDDNTTEQGFSVAKMGDKGDKGDKGDPGNQGIPGTPGENGKTPYTHYAYAWSADGTDRFTDTYPNENLLSTGIVTEKSWINTDGSIQELANGFITNFIPVSYGDIFTLTQVDTQATVGAVALYDTDKQFLSRAFSSNASIFNFKINNASAAYMRITEKSSTGTLKKGIKLEVGDKQTIYTPSPSDDFENAYPTYSGTYTDYTAQDSQNPDDYTWTRILGESGQDGKDGVAGKDGVGIKTTTVTYALSDSGTTAPTSGWTATVPTLIKGKYLWTKSVWTYTDNSTETGYSVTYVAKDGNDGQDGIAGKDGVGIKSTAITYAVSSSGTTAPSSGWVASPPTAAAGQYLWTKTVWTYTDNSTETGYSVGKMGTNGSQGPAGNGIASTAITYQASTSGTTAPTGTWSTTIPNVAANQYLWTRTVISYTNSTSSTAYSVGKMGANGANGSDGKDGEDGSNGISVSSVVEEYYVSTSPTSQAGGSWSTTVPNNADPNKYIWRRLKTTMSDSTVTYTNPALIQGMTGIYPYIGPTQPANPKENQQWWKSDSSGNVTNFYVYKSGSWQGQTIQQSVLNIIELNAVRILGSTITGTTINTSILNNSGTYQDSGATIIYNSTYNGNITADWAVENSTQNGTFILSPRNLAAISYTDAARKNPGWHWVIDNNGIDVGNPSYSAIYGGEGITIYNAQLSPAYGRVKLEFQDLMSLPEREVQSYASGWGAYSDTNKPRASRQGRQVQLFGAFKNTSNLTGGTSARTMGTLPVGFRPKADYNTMAKGSAALIFMLIIRANGNIDCAYIMGPSGTSYGFPEVAAGSIFNISCSFVAADI
ncbi:autotransporter outer membrane beta-barrel domain-containing protein, partial [Enterococcus dispar]